MHGKKFCVLLIDDDKDEYIWIKRLLAKAEVIFFELNWISDYDEAIKLINASIYDVYLVDYNLGLHNGIELLKHVHAKSSKAPMILLTGRGDITVDVKAMKAGAVDYLNKNNLTTELLERSIRYSLDRKYDQHKCQNLINELFDALSKVKTLSGLLPICSCCKKIRDDKGYWKQVETFIEERSEVDFTHSICPECARSKYPDLYEDNECTESSSA